MLVILNSQAQPLSFAAARLLTAGDELPRRLGCLNHTGAVESLSSVPVTRNRDRRLSIAR
eukprot:1891222-Rhodomonas_salina.5